MKTKLFTLLLAVAASVGTILASTKIGDLYYNLDATNKTAEVTYKSYTNYNYNEGWGITTANIPSSVTYNSVSYSVTSIGGDAFSDCRSLTSITIPNSVTSIGGDAFSDCRSLTSVTIPNSVTSIEDYAFGLCTGLTSVTIGNSVTSIGDSAFYMCTGLTSVTWNAKNCSNSGGFGSQVTSFVFSNEVEAIPASCCGGMTNLTSITIPNSVTSIGGWAFAGCTGLTSISVAMGNTVYDSRNNCNAIIETATNTLMFGCQKTIIPNSVTSIGGGAFSDCRSLTSITIPNSVTSIGEFAFFNCSSLTSVTIPNSVTSIGAYAFKGCSGLTSVTIPNSVTSIGNEAFRYCINLVSITIPNSVTSIEDYVFYNCSGLTSVTIGNSVTSIGEFAFFNCSSLTSVTIPNSVTSIGERAFSYCRSLTSITIPNSVTSIGNAAFSGCTGLTAIYATCGDLERVKQLFNNDSRVKYAPLKYSITCNVNIRGAGSVQIPENECEDLITAIPNYGYHFTQWSDGNTDNPRTIVLTQDTTFTAEFAKNSYAISTISANPEWGTTAGDTTALYLDEVEISAIPNYGYHFVRWNDYNTSNPRTVSVTEDKTFTATFAKNIYSITMNAEHGTISGNSSAEYLDFVTLTVTPDYGYHFTQWSDGLKDNPRIFRLTQDTTFTAEFAYDRVGTCGKDLALTWSYDHSTKVLTIGNAGEFTENMRFGVEAPNEMEELVIGNNVTAIGENAFAGIGTLKKVSIGESVKTIYGSAFYNCVNLETIFNYRPTPSNAYSTAFDGVDKFECKLYVLPSSIDMYKNASVWRDFYYTYAIGASETTTDQNVTIIPNENSAIVTWPTSNNAATYTLQITKDGVVFCTLIFNGAGLLIGISFAPSRDGSSHAPAATVSVAGMSFTVTGLDGACKYAYNLSVADDNNQEIVYYQGEFATTGYEGEVVPGGEPVTPGGGTTAIDNVNSATQSVGTTKFFRNGQLLILRGNELFNAQGARVE